MEALLSKPNIKANLYCKDEARHLKRKQNSIRCKQAREGFIKDKRKIPEILDVTDDSAEASKKAIKNSKPSRSDMLKDWRAAKEKQKIMSKSKKATFVVKHIVYTGERKYAKEKCGYDQKENNIESISKKKQVSQKPNQRQPIKVLQERNKNVINGQIMQKQKSYVEWKKSQKSQDTYIAKRTHTRSSNNQPKQENNVLKNTVQTQPGININKRPVTRSTKNKKENTEVKVTKTTKSKKEDSKLKITETVTGDCSELTTEYMNPEKKIECSVNEITVVDVKNNDNELTETGITPADINTMKDNESEQTENIVDVPVQFEIPVGLAWTNFKFDITAFSPKSVANKEQLVKPIIGLTSETLPQTEKISLQEKKTPDCKYIPQVESLRRSVRLNGDCGSVSNTPKTPVALFKKKQGLTPMSTPKQTNRTSLTPNPKNFFSKIEDPVTQRIESPTMKTVLKTPPDVRASVKHFTEMVAKEEEKFTFSIEKWSKVLEEGTVPEVSQGNVLAAIGQAQLFIRKRFKQFKELIELHKDKSAEKAALASDLDGFWEMIYYQVVDVHKRFVELQEMKENNWEEKIILVKKPVKKVKVPVKKPAPSKVSSKRTDFKKFREQMKAKQMAEQQEKDASGAFIDITSVINENDKVITGPPKQCSGLPATVVTCEDFSADSLEECSPVKQVRPTRSTEAAPILDNVEIKPLRRSTRKTPSKYRIVDSDALERKPEDVACNLFADSEMETGELDNDFSQYLSKTIVSEDQPVKRDLLSSFDDPSSPTVSSVAPVNRIANDDLMAFSPLPQKVSTRSKSIRASELVNDQLSLK